MKPNQAITRLLWRLDSDRALTSADREMVAKVPMSIRSIQSRSEIVHEGDVQSQCCCVLSGHLVRNRIIETSQRRILSFHIPGDIPDLHSLQIKRSDHNLTALGSVIVGLIPHDALHELAIESPRLANAFWREAVIEASILREWEISLGRKDAISRVSHLLCEMMLRLQLVDLSKDANFEFPWTQQDIGDACALSNVHVNRVVQTLRARGVITWRGRIMRIENPSELARIGDFSSGYLHLPAREQHHERFAYDGIMSQLRSCGLRFQ